MPDTATYIYCLVDRPGRPPLTRVPPGLPGATTPDLIDLGRNLWAVSAEVPLDRYAADRLEARMRDLGWIADIALAHESVVEYFAARRHSAVVPMKLFTMFSTVERAAADLKARRREVAAVLRRIRGCQEWGVRVMPPPRAAAERRTSKAASGTGFLAAKIRARDDERKMRRAAADAAEATVETLSRLARATRLRTAPDNATTPPLIDAALLVPVARVATFRTAAQKCARTCRKAGAELVLTGPWPAYNFVQGDREPA